MLRTLSRVLVPWCCRSAGLLFERLLGNMCFAKIMITNDVGVRFAIVKRCSTSASKMSTKRVVGLIMQAVQTRAQCFMYCSRGYHLRLLPTPE